jgi:hypothetical protein
VPPREQSSLLPLSPRDHSNPPAPLAALLQPEPEPPPEPASGLRERTTPSEPAVVSPPAPAPDSAATGRTFVVRDGVLTARIELRRLGQASAVALLLFGIGVFGLAAYSAFAPPEESAAYLPAGQGGAHGARAPSRPAPGIAVPEAVAAHAAASSSEAPGREQPATAVAPKPRVQGRPKASADGSAEPPAGAAPASIAATTTTPGTPPPETRLAQARACLARGDNGCVLALLEHGAQTDAEWSLLIETLRVLRQADKAEQTMQAYLARFPSGARAAAYRKLLGQKTPEP